MKIAIWQRVSFITKWKNQNWRIREDWDPGE